MTISLRADGAGTYGAVQLNGVDRLTLNADGTLSGAASPAQFDDSLKLATTDFVQRALGSYSGIVGYTASGTITLTEADVGKHIVINNATSIVLPAASSVAPGSTLHILISGATNATVTRAGTDTISRNDAQSVNTILVKAKTSLILRQGLSGTAWVVSGGDASLQFSSAFGSSLASAGYQKLPSGLIIQWMPVVTTAFNNSFNFATLPIAFPGNFLSVVISPTGAAGGIFGAEPYSATQVRFTNTYASAQNGTLFAIGY